MSNEDSPWAHQDPRWQPQSYRDAVGRNPRQPFGQPSSGANQPPQTSIEDFREQGRGGPPWWLVMVAVIAAVGLVLVVLQLVTGDEEPPPSATASPSPSVSVGQEDTPGSSATGGNSIPFEGNGTGLFELLGETWTAEGLEVTFRVTVDSGEHSFGLYMFNNTTMELADPLDMSPFYASEGSPYTGTARFAVDRSAGTLVLTTGFGRAITALPVKG
ncbi:hypothetical protein LKO27_04395 [Tessaracoccus sp. OS52]|uniref:hypothetical protein n=1 Tax=Tessaracoccus sp. OS52 TaxID=2886691 RepID=UPI001D117BC2|nr:hypothetical protein [Tessaracoccus sp. OS52]MCC2592656.1 hypothetical protein [Tessaracoccus sp. OS52]